MSELEWDGTGYPPVGANNVQFIQNKGRFNERVIRVEVDAITVDGQVVFTIKEDCGNYKMNSLDCFRPIRSKQEIDCESLMADILDYWNNQGLDCPILENKLAKHLQDAGYERLGEEVDMERFFWVCDSLLKSRGVTRLDFKNQLKSDFKIYPRGE